MFGRQRGLRPQSFVKWPAGSAFPHATDPLVLGDFVEPYQRQRTAT